MPDIFGLPPITYWQAVGLFVLSHLLFKGHQHQGPPRDKEAPWKKRWCKEAEKKEAGDDPVAQKIRHLLDDTPQAQ
jgi:hypothetical protein